MPGADPSIDFLRKLGINLPTGRQPTEKEMIDYEKIARQQPPSIAKNIIAALGGATKGLLGIDPPKEYNTQDDKWEGRANMLTQLGSAAEGPLKAGLSFAAIRKGAPVYHGSNAVFEHFNPKLNNPKAELGHLTHFAEDPKYADLYAQGLGSRAEFGSQQRSNIIPANIDAKNVLDLVNIKNPNMDDMSQMVGSLSPERRDRMIRSFRNFNRAGKPELAREMLSTDVLNELERPEAVKGMPFDAIRYGISKYGDIKSNSPVYNAFAVPRSTPLMTPAGVPLNKTGTPLDVKLIEESLGGILTPKKNRWKTSTVDVAPRPEIHK